MRENVIIFDGKDLHEIGASYFFQHPIISNMEKEEVNDVYKNTLYLHHTCTDLDEKSKYRMMRGAGILEQMILDMNGDKIGQSIINEVKLKIQ